MSALPSAIPQPPQSGNKFSVSVLSTYSSDSTPSLLVTFPDQRYLFNTPEAISRVAVQSKVGLRKVGNVFLGSIEESAGLPGFILSSVEAGNNKIEIVGPAGADHYLASCRFFTRRDKLSLKISSPPPSPSSSSSLPDEPCTLRPPTHSDTNVNVYAFTLTLDASTAATAASSARPSLKRKRSRSPSPSPSRSPSTQPKSHPVVSDELAVSFDPTSPSFQPSKLTGTSAQKWRGMVLRDMFRGDAFDRASSHSEQQADKAAPTTRERKGPTPAYLPQALPPYSGTRDAVSYLVVGPVQIGKFLPTEATRLGVKPGKMFAKLKNGERVWVRPEVPVEVAQDEATAKKETKKEKARRIKETRAKQEEIEKRLVDGEGEGAWVTPEQCMEQGQNASAFLVLNIPSPHFLSSLPRAIPPSLLRGEVLGPTTSLRTIFYLLGPGVLADARFEAYVSSIRTVLPEDVQHRVASADHIGEGKDEVTFVPSALLNLRLSELDRDMFNVPKFSFVPDFASPSSSSLGMSILSANSHFSSSDSLRPSSSSPLGGEIRSFNFELGTPEAETEASRLKGMEKPQELQDRGVSAWHDYLGKAREVQGDVLVESARRRGALEAEEPTSIRAVESGLKVTPLGTGSAIPSKYRNVSSTLIHVPIAGSDEEEYILLDAGEGTWGQLARRFGTEEARAILAKMKMIFISHLHQDHHAGLSSLLRERIRSNAGSTTTLTIVAPSNARTYLFEQHQIIDLGLTSNQIRFVDNFLLEPGKELEPGSRQSRSYDDLLRALDLEAVVAVPVLHRCRAWGMVITHQSGWRVVFSGDTMPCEALVEHGSDASLLIHEATIEDDLPDVALAKGHSTFAQAIDIATRMRARHLLLTHFSARYPKLPPASSSSTSSDSHHPLIATAFDLMTLSLSDFWKMERYRDALDSLLSWDEADEGKDVPE